MTWTNFYHSVIEQIEIRPSPKAIWIKPRLDRLPLPIQRFDEPFLPLSKAIITATKDKVAVYIFDFAAYLAIGAAGVVALERAIAYANQDAITILHGPFSGTHYQVLADDASLNISGLTVNTLEDLNYYITHPPFGAFLYSGSRIRNGGLMDEKTLTLFLSNREDTIIDIIDTDTVLQCDLSENYLSTIKQSVL